MSTLSHFAPNSINFRSIVENIHSLNYLSLNKNIVQRILCSFSNNMANCRRPTFAFPFTIQAFFKTEEKTNYSVPCINNCTRK